jgi:hypothetical protein
MRAVLITFSIDLSDEEIDQLMDDFGGGVVKLLVRREGCCELRLELSEAASCLSTVRARRRRWPREDHPIPRFCHRRRYSRVTASP